MSKAKYQKQTAQQRAQAIIEGFRGLPGEFMMLKGILCAEHILQESAERNGATWLQARQEASINIDRLLIAARMDELNDEARLHALSNE